MNRGCLLLLSAGVALAQVRPQEDPIQGAIRAYQAAHNQGQFNEAAAKRELARGLLDQIPADSPQFGNSVWSVAQLYQGSGLSAQALAIAQQGLARAVAPGQQIQLLQMVADFYQQDRNLLQAVAYREKEVAALEEAAIKPVAPNSNGLIAVRVGISGFRRGFMGSPGDNRTFAYERLADLYQQLGRPDSVAAVNKRMLAVTKEPGFVAQFYEQQGQLDEAAAIYTKQAEQADPSIRAGGLQSLAHVYQQEQRYVEAADAFQQALAALNASGKPEARQQTISIRMNLAGMLNRAGQTAAGDQVYEQLLAGSANGTDATYVLAGYANYLAETKRDAQGQALLNDYLTSHGNLHPQEEANLLFQLANGARRSGDSKLGDVYQRAGMEKQQSFQPPPTPQILIGPELQAAETAVHAGNFDEAFELSVKAMATAPGAADRDQVAWQVPNIATELANRKQSEKADQLYQRLFGLAEIWSADNPQPLMNALQNYSRFLMAPDRRNEAADSIKRYRDLIVGAHGAASISLGDAIRLTMQYERTYGTSHGVIAAVEELLALHESLGGNTSELYLGAAEELAREYQVSGDPERALPIFRRNAAIADLAFRPSDIRRAHLRLTAAVALAQQGQFDEAEKLANEAVAISKTMRPPQGDMFTTQLEQIRKMKTAPQPNPPNGNNPWFHQSKSQDQ